MGLQSVTCRPAEMTLPTMTCYLTVAGCCAQRPSAKDLLKHRFIHRAKKTSFLVELVDRYKHWRVTHPDSDDDADDSDQ